MPMSSPCHMSVSMFLSSVCLSTYEYILKAIIKPTMKTWKNGKPFICFVVTWHMRDTGIDTLRSELKVNIRL